MREALCDGNQSIHLRCAISIDVRCRCLRLPIGICISEMGLVQHYDEEPLMVVCLSSILGQRAAQSEHVSLVHARHYTCGVGCASRQLRNTQDSS